MKRAFSLCGALVVGLIVAACSSGSDGADGAKGDTGEAGATGKMGATGKTGATGPAGTSATDTPSVSAITPAYGFLERTVDLTIAGSGTTWDAKTKVTFSDPKITTNSVTIASETGLVANVTIAADAKEGPVDVTVADGTTSASYKGAFLVKSPLLITATPAAGVVQGGIANYHVQMLDLTTPFDPDTTVVTINSNDLVESQPTPTDYAFDLEVEANVLAQTGTFDLTVTSGAGASLVTSPGAKAIVIGAQKATALKVGQTVNGSIQTELDQELYSYTPSSASQQFVQFTIGSDNGQVQGTVLPASGKFADAIASGFAVRYGQGTTSAGALYAIVGDYAGFFSDGPVPADTSIKVFASACTAVSEISESTGHNDDTSATAQTVATLPGLVSGQLGYGSVHGTADIDVYKIEVPNAGKIHVITGGDQYTDVLVTILAADGSTVLATSDGSDYQQDLSFSATETGTYYVSVVPGPSSDNQGGFSDQDDTYELFIALE